MHNCEDNQGVIIVFSDMVLENNVSNLTEGGMNNIEKFRADKR